MFLGVVTKTPKNMRPDVWVPERISTAIDFASLVRILLGAGCTFLGCSPRVRVATAHAILPAPEGLRMTKSNTGTAARLRATGTDETAACRLYQQV